MYKWHAVQNLIKRHRFIVGLVTFLLLVAAPVATIYAQTIPNVSTPGQNLWFHEFSDEQSAALNPNDPTGECTPTSGVGPDIINSLSAMLVSNGQGTGSQVRTLPEFCVVLNSTTLTSQEKIKLVAGTKPGNSIAGMAFDFTLNITKQRPTSALIFAEDQLNKLIFGDIIYAQSTENIPSYFPGTGFDLLTPIQSFWGWSVTLSYSFMVFIILIVALGLVLRDRLGGKEQVKLQTAIQGIVIAMILIPLTYPISGLFIDAVTLGTNTIHGFLFNDIGPGGQVYKDGTDNKGVGFNDPNSRGLYADDPRINFFNAREQIGLRNLDDVLTASPLCSESQDNCSQLYESAGILGLVNGILGIFGSSLGELVGGLIYFAFIVITMVTSIRIGWKLFKQWLTMMLVPLVLPFIATTIAIPGQGNKMFVTYIKKLANASLNFIVAYGMILLAIIFSSTEFTSVIASGANTNDYVPPLLNGTIFDGLVGESAEGVSRLTSVFFVFMGAGIFLLIPSTLKQITDSLAPKEDLPKFLGDIRSELTSSADIALRQAPAYALSTAGNVINQSGGRLTRFVGNRRTDPFGKSTAESFVDSSKKEMSQIQENIANSGFFGRQVARASGAVQGAARSRVASALGKPTDFSVQGGEGKPDVETSTSFNNLEGENGRFTLQRDMINNILGLSGSNVKVPPGRSITFNGKLTIKPKDGAPAPSGAIFFRSHGGNVIGQLGGIDIKFAGGGGSTTSVGGTTVIAPPGSAIFTGAGGSKVDYNIEFTLETTQLNQLQTLTVNKDIEFFIGNARDAASGFKKSVDFSVNIR